MILPDQLVDGALYIFTCPMPVAGGKRVVGCWDAESHQFGVAHCPTFVVTFECVMDSKDPSISRLDLDLLKFPRAA